MTLKFGNTSQCYVYLSEYIYFHFKVLFFKFCRKRLPEITSLELYEQNNIKIENLAALPKSSSFQNRFIELF